MFKLLHYWGCPDYECFCTHYSKFSLWSWNLPRVLTLLLKKKKYNDLLVSFCHDSKFLWNQVCAETWAVTPALRILQPFQESQPSRWAIISPATQQLATFFYRYLLTWWLRNASSCCYVLHSTDLQKIAQKHSSCGVDGSQNWEEIDFFSGEMENVPLWTYRAKVWGQNKVHIILRRITLLYNSKQ